MIVNLFDLVLDDDSKAREVHERIRQTWLQIFNEFNAKRRCD